jgi:Arc/MetJ-type ribon-helix-helix transcriptional regulator
MIDSGKQGNINMPETLESETSPQQESPTPKGQTESNLPFIMENGTLFRGTKEQADRYAEHLESEKRSKQADQEKAQEKTDNYNKPRSEQKILESREELDRQGLHSIRDTGFMDHELLTMAAGYDYALDKDFASHDDPDTRELSRQNHLRSDFASNFEPKIDGSSIDSQLEAFIKNQERILDEQTAGKMPEALLAKTRQKLEGARLTLESIATMREDLEDTVKDAVERGEYAKDSQAARKLIADDWIREYNSTIELNEKRRQADKQDIIQGARSRAARSSVDDIFEAVEASKRVSGEATAETPQQAERQIDTSPDLMIQLLAEAGSTANEQIKSEPDAKKREILEKAFTQLKDIADAFQELAKLWQRDGVGKSYEEFYEELNDSVDSKDKATLRLLATAAPAHLKKNYFFAASKIAKMKQIAKSQA